ncbi:MAG: 4-(cytidine 5'-diphospho)-2-C-methyl-D-erythritol kinase [Pseudomonadota bacterium]
MRVVTDAGATVHAPAKVNLSLRVHGRRPDGYHELTSLVAFADVGDTLQVFPSYEFALHVDGTAAHRIDGENLIARAASLLEAQCSGVAPGRIHLAKHLPVGAGLGGGSADVAAYLRAVMHLNADNLALSAMTNADRSALALKLGADVPVCLHGETTWMCGIGERLVPLANPLPAMHVVLVNPGIMVPTGPVFAALDAKPMTAPPAPPPKHIELDRLANDLEAPALRVAPDIAAARAALEQMPDVQHVRMSGSGATYFGVFPDRSHANEAAFALSEAHPDWWVRAATLGVPRPDLKPIS